MKKISVIFSVLYAIALSGCANLTEAKLNKVRADYPNIDDSIINSDKNLDLLLAGDGLFQLDKYTQSDNKFEQINRKIPDAKSGVISELINVTSNNMNNPYRPSSMDSLFISYYQLWNALALGNFDTARVIINQSYDRQQSASREFSKLIERRQDSELADKLRADNSEWKVFSDITNPALTYLSGLYFLKIASDNGDWENARLYFKRAYGMSGIDFIKQDLNLSESRIRPKKTVWIFIESGFIPKLHQERIDWPVFLNGKARIVSVATAKPIEISEDVRIDGAQLLADGDAMFMTEFKEYEINRVLRSVSSATAKMMLQSVADDKIGGFAALATSIYTVASTSADVRNWATLPKRIYVLRITNPKSNLIKLYSMGTIISEMEIDKQKNNLIYLRLPNGKPKIIKFN